jgi:hypothetical protein
MLKHFQVTGSDDMRQACRIFNVSANPGERGVDAAT